MEESIHVRFDDKLDPRKSNLFENFADLEINLAVSGEKDKDSNKKDDISEGIECPSVQKRKRQRQTISEDLILRDKAEPVRIRSTFKQIEETLLGLVSLIEPTSCQEALQDNKQILEVQEKLNQFSRNDVWDLVPKP